MPPLPIDRALTGSGCPGLGTIWSFVVCHPPLLPAYAPFAPYPVITVTLDEGPALRMVGNLVTGPDGPINGIDPATIVIGEPVRVVFSRRRGPDGREVFLPVWVRDTGDVRSDGSHQMREKGQIGTEIRVFRPSFAAIRVISLDAMREDQRFRGNPTAGERPATPEREPLG